MLKFKKTSFWASAKNPVVMAIIHKNSNKLRNIVSQIDSPHSYFLHDIQHHKDL